MPILKTDSTHRALTELLQKRITGDRDLLEAPEQTHEQTTLARGRLQAYRELQQELEDADD